MRRTIAFVIMVAALVPVVARATDVVGIYVNGASDPNIEGNKAGQQKVGVVRTAGTTSGNSFDADDYVLASSCSKWLMWWDGANQVKLDWNGWRGVGQDANGTVKHSHPELRSFLLALVQPGPQGVPEQSLTDVAP